MMYNINEHAIKNHYNTLDIDNKKFFIFITKIIIDFGIKYNYNILNIYGLLPYIWIFKDYETFVDYPDNVIILSRLYGKYKLFKQISNTEDLTEYINNFDQNDNIKKLLKIILKLKTDMVNGDKRILSYTHNDIIKMFEDYN